MWCDKSYFCVVGKYLALQIFYSINVKSCLFATSQRTRFYPPRIFLVFILALRILLMKFMIFIFEIYDIHNSNLTTAMKCMINDHMID